MCYDIIYDICSFAVADPAPAQRADDSDADLDGPMDADEARDFADQDPPSAMDMEADAEILATLLKHIPSCMNADDIEQLLQDIPVQPPVVVPIRTVQEAIAAGDLPALDVDQHGTNAGELQNLIQRVLHHPDFNADEVDHDLHERLMKAVEQGDIEVIDMWEEGDGPQDNTFVKRKVAKVLRELLSDERMAGRQHFGFKLSTDANGERVLGGDANGSLSFELAQFRLGPGTVPISIVLYIDATFIKQGIPIRPIYSELQLNL